MLILKDMADRNIFISARIFQAVLYKSFKIKFLCDRLDQVQSICERHDDKIFYKETDFFYIMEVIAGLFSFTF